MFHPNVYENGDVCISILHEAEVDETNQFEQLSEKWKPVLGAKEVILSILSLLHEPNPESPANTDAAILFRKSKSEYRKFVMKILNQK